MDALRERLETPSSSTALGPTCLALELGPYAVVYLDGHCQPLGGPRFTLAVEQIDRRLVLTDGDRTFKPRPRG